MNSIVSNFITIIPLIGMISGLSLGIIIPIFFIAVLISIWPVKINFDYEQHKTELALILWTFLCCFWSSDPVLSLKAWCKIIIIIVSATYIIITNITSLKLHPASLYYNFFLACLLPIILFILEISSHGVISSLLRKTFQNQENPDFLLSFLDRGVSIIGIFSWIIIALLLKNRHYFLATMLYLAVLSISIVSDSLATTVGFATAGIVFLLIKYLAFLRKNIVTSSIFVSLSCLMLISFYSMNPMRLSNEYNYLPLSAKHRLFIWHYVAEHSSENILFGYGFDGSRQYDVPKEDMVIYKGHVLTPLSVHPHNAALQILFETGIVGLILYFMAITKLFARISNVSDHSDWDKTYMAIKYASFTTYIAISFISFSMWKFWWIAVQSWIIFAFYLADYYFLSEQKTNQDNV